MYVPAHFAENHPQALHELIRLFPLGVLITQGAASTVDLTPFRPSRVAEGRLWRDEHDYDLTQQTISR